MKDMAAARIAHDDDTLMIRCPACESDIAETLGVTGPFDQSLKSTVVMRCGDCATVYLSPPPVSDDGDHAAGRAAINAFDAAIRHQKSRVSAGARFYCTLPEQLEIDCDAVAGHLDHLLLPLSPESSARPEALLRNAALLLDDGGKLDLVLANVDSSCFRTFGGRHWFAYRFPGTRQQFGVCGISRVADKAGFRVAKSTTFAAPAAWLLSTRNWLVDWRASKFTIALLTGRWVVPWIVAWLLERIALLRGRASILVVRLEKA